MAQRENICEAHQGELQGAGSACGAYEKLSIYIYIITIKSKIQNKSEDI